MTADGSVTVASSSSTIRASVSFAGVSTRFVSKATDGMNGELSNGGASVAISSATGGTIGSLSFKATLSEVGGSGEEEVSAGTSGEVSAGGIAVVVDVTFRTSGVALSGVVVGCSVTDEAVVASVDV